VRRGSLPSDDVVSTPTSCDDDVVNEMVVVPVVLFMLALLVYNILAKLYYTVIVHKTETDVPNG
jgi:hypothetical protein